MAIPKFEDFLYPFMQHLIEKDSETYLKSSSNSFEDGF